MKKQFLTFVAVTLISTCFCGCQNVRRDNQKFGQLARQVMGDDGKHYLTVIRSQGAINDTMVVGFSTVFGISRAAADMAEWMAQGEKKLIKVGVTGYSREKNKRIILHAVALNKGRKLSKLHFMYFGFPEDEKIIGDAIRSLSASYYFEPVESILIQEDM